MNMWMPDDGGDEYSNGSVFPPVTGLRSLEYPH